MRDERSIHYGSLEGVSGGGLSAKDNEMFNQKIRDAIDKSSLNYERQINQLYSEINELRKQMNHNYPYR